MTISVAEILGRPGEHRDISVSEPLVGVQTELARVGSGPVKAELRAESVVEGILVTGRVAGPAVLRCARCLAEFDAPVHLEVCELFAIPGHVGAEDDDFYEVSGTEIHLEQMLRDALALALPLNPVCRADCRGICSRCGRDLVDESCSCTESHADPRWDALDEIRARLETKEA